MVVLTRRLFPAPVVGDLAVDDRKRPAQLIELRGEVFPALPQQPQAPARCRVARDVLGEYGDDGQRHTSVAGVQQHLDQGPGRRGGPVCRGTVSAERLGVRSSAVSRC